MKILFVTDYLYPQTNGAAVRCEKWLEHFKKMGHEVTLASGSRKRTDVPMIKVSVAMYKYLDLSLFSFRLMKLIWQKKHDVIVIVIPSAPLLPLVVLPLAKLRGIPICLYEVGNLMQYLKYYPFFKVYKPIMRFFYYIWPKLFVDKYIGPTLIALKHLQENGITEIPFTSVRTGIENDLFYPMQDTPFRAKYEKATGKKTIVLYVGRIADEKNVPLLLKVAEEMPHIGFVFVGEGPHKEKYIKKYKTHKHIFFDKAYKHSVLGQVYNAADLFISLSKVETCGFTLLEAMASGTPILAFNDGAINEMHSSLPEFLIPTDSNEMIEQQNVKRRVTEILANKKSSYQEKLKAYMQNFQWDKSAEDAIYEFNTTESRQPRLFSKAKFSFFFLFASLFIFFSLPIIWILNTIIYIKHRKTRPTI